MDRYKVESYNPTTGNHTIRQIKTQERFTIDLYVDGSFNPPIPDGIPFSEVQHIKSQLVGKFIDIEEILFMPAFAKNCKITSYSNNILKEST